MEYTVEGELGVANFLVTSFKRGPLADTCGCAPLPICPPKVPLLVLAERGGGSPHHSASLTLLSFPSSFPNPARVSALVSAIMAPQLNTAQHILIKTLLKAGFETKLIASEASCNVVQRARRPENPSEETAVRNAHHPPKNKPRRPS
jgi:hypothetical protein